MKIYHDHDEDGTWTEITTIKSYPTIKPRLDETSRIFFIINDFEGALYATWEGYNFIPILITDGTSTGPPPTNIIFRGYLTGKTFKRNELNCACEGLAARLEWEPFRKNYIQEDGFIKTVPYAGVDVPQSGIVRPTGDDGNTWTFPMAPSSIHDAVDNVVTQPDINTDDSAYAINGDDGESQTLDMGTLTATEVTIVKVWIYGTRSPDADQTGTVEINLGGWEAAKDTNFTTSDAWHSYEWTALSGSQADLNGLQIRIKASDNIDAANLFRVYIVYAELTYTGTSDYALELKDSDGDDFIWTQDDRWSQDIDAGIMITDTTSNWSSKSYPTSGIAAADHTATTGNAASCQTKNDDNAFTVSDTGTYDATGTITLSGDNIDSTVYSLKQIDIAFNWSSYLTGNGWQRAYLEILYNTTTWKTIAVKVVASAETEFWGDVWSAGTYTITGTNTELAKYMTKTGDNYDGIDEIRIRLQSDVSQGASTSIVRCDYLKATISYYDQDITPIMEQIDSSGDTWIFCDGVTWADMGVGVEDSFQIGLSTSHVLADIFLLSGISLKVNSTPTKYMAQHFKGTYAIEVLKKVCLLEGFHWFEDYVNNRVVVAKEADFVDSAVDLTQANYDHDWEFEDDNNYYYAVEVYGAAASNVYYRAEDLTIDSPRVKTIIEETIMTNPEAKTVADTQLLEYKTKRPSIKIILNGVNSALVVGKTVGLTMVRPTVGEVDYPIRMIERSRFGAGIKTVIYCGLGHSTEAEKIADLINKTAYLTHKAHTDRLVSTPFSAAASFTWSDIGGAEAAVDGIIAGTNHTVLANPNGEADEQHLTAAQVAALHAVQAAGDFSHNSLANLNAGDVYEHISAGQLAALHTAVVAGDLSHNDLANIDAADIKHITAAQLGALHAIYTDADAQAVSINNLSEDASPQLGAHLDLAGFGINDDSGDNLINLFDNTSITGTLHVTGNISTVGTVDGVDIAARDHAAVTVNAPIILTAQDIELKNDAAAQITEIDTDVNLAGGDTKIPTDLAVKTYVDNLTVGDTKEVSHAYVEATALTLENDLTMGGHDIISSDALNFKVAGIDVDYLQITTAGGHPSILTVGGGNLQLNPSGPNVVITGSLTISGLVDGVDIAARDHPQLTNLTELGTRNHNDLLNIDAADIKHITAAQLAALHTRVHTMVSTDDHHQATTHKVFYSDANGHVIELALGADGEVLTSTGAATAPAFEVVPGAGEGISEAAVYALLGVGAANKRWKNCIFRMGITGLFSNVATGETNVGASNMALVYSIPLPYIIGTKNLVITQTKIGVYAANGTNYVNNTYGRGWADETGPANTWTDATNLNAQGTFTHNHADVTVGGNFTLFEIYLACVNAVANNLQIGFVQIEYYYV